MPQKLSLKDALKQTFDYDIEKKAAELEKDPEFEKMRVRLLERLNKQLNLQNASKPQKRTREVPENFEEVTEKADQMQSGGSSGMGLGE